MSKFKREERYIAAKIKDAQKALSGEEIGQLRSLLEKIESYRESVGKIPLRCVCIESDWSCYDDAWFLVEREIIVDERIATEKKDRWIDKRLKCETNYKTKSRNSKYSRFHI